MGAQSPIEPSEPDRPNQPAPSLQRVLDLCDQMNAKRELPRLLELIAREGTNLLECERVTIFLLDREKCELVSQVTLDGVKIRLDARLGIAGACAMTGQVIRVDDAQQDQRFYTAVDARTSFRTKTVLAIPLKNPTGEVVGVLQCINTRHGLFTPEDDRIARALAGRAAAAIDTSGFVEDFKRQQARLEAENAQLRKEVEGRFPTQQIIGTSEPIQFIVRLIDQIRDSSVDVLITGESGTGKEASVDKGVLVRKMGGGQVDTVRGDFVFEIQEGYLIEKGAIGPMIKNATMMGNGPKVLRDIDMVGNDLGFALGTCGKDGQGVPVSDAQPTVRIPEITVGGKKQ